MISVRSVLLFFLILLISGWMYILYADCSEDRIASIFSRENNLSILTFRADFLQRHKSRVFRDPKISEGVIFIKIPDLFKIHTIEPKEEIFIIKGDLMIRYDPSAGEKKVEKLNRYMEDFQLFYLFNVDYEKLKGNYYLRCIEEEDLYRINLSPKNANLQRRLLNIIITVSKEDHIITSISYYLRNEEKIHIYFSNICVNSELDDRIFETENW